MAEDEIDIYLNLHVKDIEGTLGEAISDPEGSFGSDKASDIFEIIAKGLSDMYEKNDDLQSREFKDMIEGLKTDSQSIERALTEVLNRIETLDEEGLADNIGEILEEVNLMGKLNELMIKMMGEDTDITKDLTEVFEEASDLIRESNFVNKGKYDEFINNLASVSQSIEESGTFRDKLEFMNLLKQIPTPDVDFNIEDMAEKITKVRDTLEGRTVKDAEGNVIRRRALRVDDMKEIVAVLNEFEQNISLVTTEHEKQRDIGNALIKAVHEANFPQLMIDVVQARGEIESWNIRLRALHEGLEDITKEFTYLVRAAQDLRGIGETITSVIVNALTTAKLEDIIAAQIGGAIKTFFTDENVNFTIEGQEISRNMIKDIAETIYSENSNMEREIYLGILDMMGKTVDRLVAIIKDRTDVGKPLTAYSLTEKKGMGLKESFLATLESLSSGRLPKQMRETIQFRQSKDIARMFSKYRQDNSDISELTEDERKMFDETFGKDIVDAIILAKTEGKTPIEILTDMYDAHMQSQSSDVINESEAILKAIPSEALDQSNIHWDENTKRLATTLAEDSDDDEETMKVDYMNYFNGVDTMFENKFNEFDAINTSHHLKYIQKVDMLGNTLTSQMTGMEGKIDTMLDIFNEVKNSSVSSTAVERVNTEDTTEKEGYISKLRQLFGRSG